MRALKILLTPLCLIVVLTFSNCEVKLHCGSLSKKNPALSISMFQQPVETITFWSDTRKKLVLKKAHYAFNKPYTFTCEPSGFMATFPNPCECREEFTSLYYLNDTIPFSVQMALIKPDDEFPESTLAFYLAVAGTTFYENIHPGPEAVVQFVEDKIVATKHIENVFFKNIWDMPITNDPHISRVVIQQHVGLVAIVYDGELYLLQRGVSFI